MQLGRRPALLVALLMVLLPANANGAGLDLDLNEPAPESVEPVEPATKAACKWPVWMSSASSAVKSSLEALPKYFDFAQFQRKFQRRYKPGELIYRKAAFLKRCYQVFKARIAHRLGLLTYSQSINKFADRSPNEIKQMFMSGPPIEFRRAGQSEQEYFAELERVSRERDQDDLELDSCAGVDGDNNGDASSDMIFNEQQARQVIEQMQAEAASDQALRMAIRDELRGAPAGETYSQAAGESASEPPQELPWPGREKSGLDLNEEEGAAYAPPALGPDDALDWSRHPCFHTIYDQGDKCGKCYVMASTALAEFYKCSELENVVEQRKFSKKYVLDCGQKFSPTILGCKGGSLLDTLRFMALGGVHNIDGWKTELKQRKQVHNGELDKKCPLDRFHTPVREWGAIRVEMNPRRVAASGWVRALQDGPLVVSVQMPAVGLETYDGGVHDGEGCAQSGNWHAMVLVGYGVSPAGTAYWRFRNSWGADWGDQGHFNLATSVSGECLAGGVRVYREPLAE